MKKIEQLLELTKNPFYKFTAEEQAVIDDFLFKKREKALKRSRRKTSKKSSKRTRATVRNVVEKVDTYPPEVA